jgi:hypothetical protein
MMETIFTASESVSPVTTCAGMTSVLPRPPATSRWLRSGMSASPEEMARNARFIAATAAGMGRVRRTWLALSISIDRASVPGLAASAHRLGGRVRGIGSGGRVCLCLYSGLRA